MFPLGNSDVSFYDVYPHDTGAGGYGKVFSVGDKSIVCRMYVSSGESLEANDIFELHLALEYDKDTRVPTRTVQLRENDPVSGTDYSLTLGQNHVQAEIVIRGNYVWKKIVSTTASLGVQASRGYEGKI